MVTLSDSGTKLAVIGTEHTLFSSTASRRYDGWIDLANMASGDTTEIRVYVKIKSGGSFRQHAVSSFVNAQTDTALYIIPFPSDVEYKLTLKQTAGTGRNYDWRVYET